MDAIQIIATGKALPKKLVTNDDMSKIVDTSDEWISTRTGIKQRYFCDGEQNWELAFRAATEALTRGNIEKEQIGAVIVGTGTPDYIMPSMACILQEELPKGNQQQQKSEHGNRNHEFLNPPTLMTAHQSGYRSLQHAGSDVTLATENTRTED